MAQHRGQQRSRLVDRADADVVREALGLPRAQAPDRDLGERHVAEPRLGVQPVDVGVAVAGRLLQRRRVLGRPSPEHAWYYPGRDHILFTIEDEIHYGSMLAWRLPKLPPALREALGYEGLPSPAVMILPPELTESG